MNVSVIGECKSLEGLYLVLVYYRFFLPHLMDGLTIWIFFLYVHYFLLVFFCILPSRLLIINVQQLHTTTSLSIDFPHFQKPPLPLLNVVDCTGKNPSSLSLSLITPLTALKFAILSFSLYSADCQPLLVFFTTFASY